MFSNGTDVFGRTKGLILIQASTLTEVRAHSGAHNWLDIPQYNTQGRGYNYGGWNQYGGGDFDFNITKIYYHPCFHCNKSFCYTRRCKAKC